jgi:hypothetical protein
LLGVSKVSRMGMVSGDYFEVYVLYGLGFRNSWSIEIWMLYNCFEDRDGIYELYD